jgi:hypothetical protein
MHDMTAIDEKSNDAQDQSMKILLSNPKAVWADSERENNS